MILSFRQIISKIADLISISNNKPLFLYRMHHYLRKPINNRVAKRFAQKNIEFYRNRKIDLMWNDTYDGSSQICHPDVVLWNNYYWMIGTPYPYGLEEYENPSLWYGDEMNEMHPYIDLPIAFPTKKGYGSHLSDPCLFVNDKQLYCIYRDTLNYGNDKIENRICYKIISLDVCGISEEFEMMNSSEDALLSPSVIECEGEKYMFYVSYIEKKLQLKRTQLNDMFEPFDLKNVEVENLESEWDIWHFDLKKFGDDICGLFLLRNRNIERYFKLVKGKLSIDKNNLVLESEVELPSGLKDIVSNPYKSCILPNKDILLSCRDKNAVYILTII